MARRLACELDDVFSQIGFDGSDPRFFEKIVQVNFLGSHRFALDGGFRPVAAGDIEDCLVRRICVCGEVHLGADPLKIFEKDFEMAIQLIEGAPPDLPGPGPEGQRGGD